MRTPALLCVLVAAVAHSAEKPKLALTDLSRPASIDPAIATALQDALASEISRRGYFQVVTSKEITVLLGIERQKQLLGCAEDATSCLAELSGALGARFVMSGSLAQLGDAVQLSLQVQDTDKAKVVGRSTRIAKDLSTLQGLIPWAVAEASGTPLPPPKSKVIPIALIGLGSLGVIGGGTIGALSLNQQTIINSQVRRAAEGNGRLEPLASYEESNDDLARKKTFGLLALGLGAAAIGVGISLWPADPTAHAALVPTGNGMALVGAFP